MGNDQLDGFIKLQDAQSRWATSRVGILGEVAEVALKWEQVNQAHEQTIKARLENLAKKLDIVWDAQAHKHLLKIRNLALQDERNIQREAMAVRNRAREINRLLTGGGSWDAVAAAWRAFDFFRARTTTDAVIAIGQLEVDSLAYMPVAWRHPWNTEIHPLHENRRDIGGLLEWARSRTYFPVTGTEAWKAISQVVGVLGRAASEEAIKLETKAIEAEKEAREISKIDWDRLKE